MIAETFTVLKNLSGLWKIRGLTNGKNPGPRVQHLFSQAMKGKNDRIAHSAGPVYSTAYWGGSGAKRDGGERERPIGQIRV